MRSMKTSPDSTSSGTRIGHERHNNANSKEDHDTSMHYKNVPNSGDVGTLGHGIPNHRASDAVSCWGDVPKRQTRLIDLFNDVDEGSNTTSRTPMNLNANLTQRAVDRCNTSETHGNSVKSPCSSRSKLTPTTTSTFGDSKTSSSEDVKSNQIKTTNGTGRERLLEWLRSSQAKRDENNRQVFTRWIDRIESMNNHEAVAVNLSSAAALATAAVANVGTTGPMDFSQGPLFAQPLPGTVSGANGASLPGLLAAPTFLIGNPVGMMSAHGTTSVNPHVTKSAVPYHNPLLTNTCHPTMLPGKTTSMNNLSYLTTMIPNLISVTPAPASTVDGSHSDALLSSPKESDTNKTENGSQSVGNAHNNPLCTSYGSDTSSTSAATTGTVCDNPLTTKPNATNCTDPLPHGQPQMSVSPIYFPPTAPLNTIDASMLTGTIQPTSYYIPMPLVNDPSSSNMYYYYYYQNHLTNCNGATPNSNMSGPAGGVNKMLTMTQPFVYYIPTPGTQPALPTPAHSLYMPDSCMCLPNYHTMVDPASYEMGNRRMDASRDGTLDSSATLYPSVIPLASGSASLSSDSKTSGLLNVANGEPHSLNTNNNSNSNKLGTNGSVIVNESATKESADGDQNRPNDTMEFDVKNWYSVLHEIASPSTAEGQLGTKTTKRSGSLMHSNPSSQPLIMDSGSMSKTIQSGNL